MCSKFRRAFLIILFVLSSTLAIACPSLLDKPAQAQATSADFIPTIAYEFDGRQLNVLDFGNITVNSLPPLIERIDISVPQDLVAQIVYDPSYTCEAGTKVGDCIHLGDWEEALHPEAFSLKDVLSLTSLPTQNLRLDQFTTVSWQTPKSLEQAIPGLGELNVSQVKPFSDLLSRVGAGASWNEKIATIAQDRILGNLELGQYLDLSQYSLTDETGIPGLVDIQINKLLDWEETPFSGVPGLEFIPFSQFPSSPFTEIERVAIADIMFGPAEHGRVVNEYLSGTVVKDHKNVPVPCGADQSCAHIEFTDGSIWAVGGEGGMEVEGGFGPLTLISHIEPAGRTVYFRDLKLILKNTNESEGTAEFGFNTRLCKRIPFYGRSCSSYFIPLPLRFVITEGEPMVVSTAF